MKTIRTVIVSLFMLISTSTIHAEVRLFHPYVLSSNAPGDPVKTLIELKQALIEGGFSVVGEYVLDPGRQVIVVTNDDLRQSARREPDALFLVAQHIAVTQFDGRVQVSYTNPEYYARAYRVRSDIDPVRARLREILGEQLTFGGGLSAERLARYRYSFGMEQFDDFLSLARFADHQAAVRAVERGLSQLTGKLRRVYRIDLPEVASVVFGVGFIEGPGSDRAIYEAIDSAPLKHTARFPFTLVVRQGEVFSLHPRFKLPLDFPGLERTGPHSLTGVLEIPGARVETLLSILK